MSDAYQLSMTDEIAKLDESMSKLESLALIDKNASNSLLTSYIAYNNQTADFIKDNSTLANKIA
jgi:hypothetical protein